MSRRNQEGYAAGVAGDAPTVSVILSAYNRGAVMACAIESVLGQTFQDWELIVVCDACTDDSAEVAARYRDPRIRFTNLAENHGEQSGPNNAGFELSRGSIIAYLNQDDLWFRRPPGNWRWP